MATADATTPPLQTPPTSDAATTVSSDSTASTSDDSSGTISRPPIDTGAAMRAALAAAPSSGGSGGGGSGEGDGWFARSLSSDGQVRGDPSLRLAGATATRVRGVRLGNGCAAGAEIMSENAFACALLATEVERRCAHCWALLQQQADGAAAESASGAGASAAAPPARAPVQRCGGCSSARYCGRSCQVSHWRVHRVECTCFRHYKSRPRDQHPAYLPTVAIACRVVLFRMAAPMRTLALALTDTAVKESPTWRALEAKRKEKEQQRDGDIMQQFDDWYARLERTVSNLEQHTPERRQSYFEMAQLVREVTLHACTSDLERELHAQLFPIQWFQELFARLNCNSFSVCDDELRPVGSALYPTVAMLNHSCAPNAVASFCFAGTGGGAVGGGRPAVKIRAIRSLQPGEEVCISYIGLAQPASARQKTLRSSYYFECDCTACQAASDEWRHDASPRRREGWLRNKSMDAMKCEHPWKYDARNTHAPSSTEEGQTGLEKDLTQQLVLSPAATAAPSSSKAASNVSCDGILLSNPASPLFPQCSRCSRAHNLAFLDAQMQRHVVPLMNEAQTLSQALSRARPGAERGAILPQARRALERALAALRTVHAPPAFQLLSCLDQLLTACIDLGDWDAAYAYAAASLPFYEVYYSGLSHPLLALQHLTHAKLAWLLQRPAEALRSWKRALPILRLTHGPRHELVKQVVEAIPPAEMELAHEQSTSRRIRA